MKPIFRVPLGREMTLGSGRATAWTAPAGSGLSRNVTRFRGGLEFKAHRLLYHSTLGLRVIKKTKLCLSQSGLLNMRRPEVNSLMCGTPPSTFDVKTNSQSDSDGDSIHEITLDTHHRGLFFSSLLLSSLELSDTQVYFCKVVVLKLRRGRAGTSRV